VVVNQIAGQQGMFTTGEIQNYLRGIIIQRLTDTLADQQRALLDLAGVYGEVALTARARVQEDFAALGLHLGALYVQAITPTEETARAIDERASMGAIGDMDAYMKFKAARALGDAAANQAGGAGTGVGLGAGIGLGAGVAGMLGQAFQQPQQSQQPQPQQTVAAPGAGAGPLTRAQVQEAIDALDMRFSKGEISEDAYNRMLHRWENRLKELDG
jgi:membrane protease subunit (stomatin/prohibitin family)